MRKTLELLLLLLFTSCAALAQSGSVKGVIKDTLNKETLGNTSISVLRGGDSVLQKFTRSDASGNFMMSGLADGKYLLFVTYPLYADYMDAFEIKDGNAVNMGLIPLTTREHVLQDVIVKQKISAIRMKGDTVEFKADSFKVREGASVEEMLKKLPGVQVDKDGKITAMGEKVDKVLVDGEEFFGDDPTIATQNLQADAVDKVQVFDKKSDQAEFTGIDDGQRSKTINLQLKEDKKKGYFGKLELGGGLNDFWSNSAMINSFKAKRKLSAYGVMSSTGKTGLDWSERDQYGSSDGPEYNDDFGGFVFYGGGDEFDNGSYYGQGLPKSWATGLNYSNKFNDAKQNLNGSYRYNKLNSEGSGSTLSQSILPDTVFINREFGNTFSSRQRHAINGTFEWNLDSSSSIKIKTNGSLGTSYSISKYQGSSTNEDGNVVNGTIRNNSSDGDNGKLVSSILYRKKFKKMGRSISFSIDQNYSENNSDGYLFSANAFYDKLGQLNYTDTTDQKKTNSSIANSINTKLTYTEPITKTLFLELNYGLRSNRTDAEILSFDKDLSGKYANLNDSFSNHYIFNVLTNSGGLTFKYNGKKLTLTAGSNIADANYTQNDLLGNATLKRNFTNIFPRAGITYKINQGSRLSINYNGNTRQPTIQQIQPVPDNSNPLVVTIGNPLLNQEFDHRINFNFNSFKVLSQRGFFWYGSVQLQSNAIVTSTQVNTTDSAGKTVYQYINTNGNYNYYTGLSYNMKLKKPDMRINFGFDFNGSRYSNFVNGIKNTTNNNYYAFTYGLGKNKEKKYDLYYYGNVGYNVSTSSVNTSIKTNYWTQSHNLGLNIQLPLKLELNNEVEANFRQKTALFSRNNNVVLWNAYIGKKFLKNDKAMIKFSGHDILNQNKGYDRIITSNTLQESNYQTINRFFMLSFVWNFTKNAATATPN